MNLKTATGEKAKIQRKRDASIECRSRKFQHRVYVADITDSYILGLDLLPYLVCIYNPKRIRGMNPKIQQNWEGPYTIVKKLNNIVYRVQR
ncbi:hypothetical protein AVEN_24577-1 [Araneus ventricosus]|uniref:Uncharacterized protein n=1 Tax=Araneus ventricosus TaxID=182803 RepID=A0A4Y2FAC7_ARAVE|nr:hypothetical protein AVEN_24577-1 [Araneus ventricosus]